MFDTPNASLPLEALAAKVLELYGDSEWLRVTLKGEDVRRLATAATALAACVAALEQIQQAALATPQREPLDMLRGIALRAGAALVGARKALGVTDG
jgi:hypothetical protein